MHAVQLKYSNGRSSTVVHLSKHCSETECGARMNGDQWHVIENDTRKAMSAANCKYCLRAETTE